MVVAKVGGCKGHFPDAVAGLDLDAFTLRPFACITMLSVSILELALVALLRL